MKKQNLSKFALSLVCAAVLTACGGSSNKAPDTTDADKAKQEQEQKAKELQAKKDALAAAAKAAGLTDAQAAQFANIDANLALDPKSDAFKAAIEAFKAQQKKEAWAVAANGSTSHPGYKLVQKVDSDLELLSGDKTTSSKSGGAQPMGVQDPNRRLDNIVVAQSTTGKDSRGAFNAIYLEDFDFSTFKDSAAESATTLPVVEQDHAYLKDIVKADGTLTSKTDKAYLAETTRSVPEVGYIQLNNLYIAQNTIEDSRNTYDEVRTGKWTEQLTKDPITRTAKQGKKTGVALVFEKGRADYTEQAGYTDNTGATGLKLEFVANESVLDSTNASVYEDTSKTKKTGYRIGGTVAEVYGYRTFADANQYKVTAKARGDHKQANLPLVNYVKEGKRSGVLDGIEYQGAQLKHVQYGRVTSALHEVDPEDLKVGVLKNTRVASYGLYGNPGTENNYFYRGVDSTNAEQLAKVLSNADNVKLGKLTYEGHAVAYGLKQDPRTDDGRVPTALAGKADGFFSGNHVLATINLADNSVKGSIYNRFLTDKTDVFKDLDLVTFQGALGKDGNIVGESALAYETNLGNKEGSFNATLFGADANEMGGALASNKRDADQWGAVFGAIKTQGSGIRESVDGSTKTTP